MKRPIYSVAVASIVFLMPAAFAQQSGAGAAKTSSAQSAPAAQAQPADFDKQYAQMQEQMKKMQEQMDRIRQTQEPKDRQQLLQQHWDSMQNAMTMMHGMMGSAGCCGSGGHMMGGSMMGGPMMGGHMMMWNDYRNLTTDQLKQRQYMMDRWMPMQQMMMDHMMWHQQWMMQPPAGPQK